MNEFNIDDYLGSLPEDILIINVANKGLTYLPDLSRFTKLRRLYCQANKLTSLPKLNESLAILNCSQNLLTSLPELNKNICSLLCHHNYIVQLPKLNEELMELNCSNNKLTSLPKLNEKLVKLNCSNNKLTSLPKLNTNIFLLCCGYNELISLPEINDKMLQFRCEENLISDVLHIKNEWLCIAGLYREIGIIRQKVKIHNRFRLLFYTLKYKKYFRDWLWRIRESKIKERYSPNNLLKLLEDNNEEDLDTLLDKW